jgi:hypothetical protein
MNTELKCFGFFPACQVDVWNQGKSASEISSDAQISSEGNIH